MTQTPLTAADTSVLCTLPFHTYFLVAGADGSIDADELKGFFEGVQLMGESDDPTMAGIFTETKASFDRAYREVVALNGRSGPEGLLSALRQGSDLARSRLQADGGSRFLQTLYFLGKMVAEASGAGDGSGGHDANVSAEEQKALQDLAAALSVEV